MNRTTKYDTEKVNETKVVELRELKAGDAFTMNSGRVLWVYVETKNRNGEDRVTVVPLIDDTYAVPMYFKPSMPVIPVSEVTIRYEL